LASAAFLVYKYGGFSDVLEGDIEPTLKYIAALKEESKEASARKTSIDLTVQPAELETDSRPAQPIATRKKSAPARNVSVAGKEMRIEPEYFDKFCRQAFLYSCWLRPEGRKREEFKDILRRIYLDAAVSYLEKGYYKKANDIAGRYLPYHN